MNEEGVIIDFFYKISRVQENVKSMEKQLIIAVASENPVKLQAAKAAFRQVFLPETKKSFIEGFIEWFDDIFNQDEVIFVSTGVPSGVSVQPKTEAETLQGALNRLRGIQEKWPGADYWISFESGITDDGEVMDEIGYAVVAESGGARWYRGQVPRFEVPCAIADLIRDGMEMGPANDQVSGKTNSKQAGGVAGEVTNQLMTRYDICYIAAVLAFSQLKNKHLYENSTASTRIVAYQ